MDLEKTLRCIELVEDYGSDIRTHVFRMASDVEILASNDINVAELIAGIETINRALDTLDSQAANASAYLSAQGFRRRRRR